MKFTAAIIFLNYLVIAASDSLTEEHAKNQFKNVEEEISNSFDQKTNFDENNLKLLNSMDRLMNKTEDNYSKLLERIFKLETLGETLKDNQKSLNDRNRIIMSNLSLVANNIRRMLDIKLNYITSCKEPFESSIYQLIYPKLKVYCEQDSFRGGWLVIQQRVDHKLNFNRSWSEYQDGFGAVGKTNDFWLGLEAIHQITKNGPCELAVEMKDKSGVYKYARYSRFGVAEEGEKYKLTVGGYSGTAGDKLYYHNNMKFTTFDNDNDSTSDNCAQIYGNGWWFHSCYHCNLNRPGGGMWSESRNDGDKLSYSRMMIRCR